MKVEELNAIMESIVFDEIKNSILNESMGDMMEKYHVTCEGEPVVTCDTQEDAEEHVDKLAKELDSVEHGSCDDFFGFGIGQSLQIL